MSDNMARNSNDRGYTCFTFYDMKKKLAWVALASIVLIIFFCCTAFAENVASGTCGENLTWTLDNQGKLTIVGSGDMDDYRIDRVPWYSNKYLITSVIIQGTVKKIGEYAFSDCSNLSTISFPDSLTNIAPRAFSGCEKLDNINLPSGVTSIAEGTFYRCTSLKNIELPNGVVIIHPNAFSDCRSLTEFTLPESVRIIGDGAFCSCSKLTAFYVPESNRFFSAVDGVLYNKKKTTLICCPAGKTEFPAIESSVTRIGNYAFFGCCKWEWETRLLIPENVTSIGDHAFDSSYGFPVIHENVKQFGKDVFINRGSKIFCTINSAAAEYISKQPADFYSEELWLSDGKAFAFQIVFNSEGEKTGVALRDIPYGVETIDIPEYVTCIEQDAIHGNSIKSVSIPDSVTQIKQYAFDCPSLESISITGNEVNIGNYAFSTCSGLTDVYIGTGVRTIGNNVFSNCKLLTNLEIEPGVTTIGANAFQNCIGLTSVTIPNTVINIGSNAFGGCSNLTDIYLPAGLMSIGDQNCNALYHVAKDSYVEGWAKQKGKRYTTDIDGQNSCGENVTWSLSDIGILTITGNGQMTSHPWDIWNVKGVVIENGITNICDDAFANPNIYDNMASPLISVTIPATVTSIGKRAFYQCGNLGEITIPDNVTSIGEEAFCNCSGLTAISIPNSVTSIGTDAFSYCRNLKQITLSNKLTSITGFENCLSLENISIPSGITSIGDCAFSGCSKLSIVMIPEGVTEICENAFTFCGITTISIPESVTSIENDAFGGCTKLTEITIPGSPIIGDSAFSDIGDGAVFYVYGGSRAHAWAVKNNVTFSLLGTKQKCGDNLTWQVDDNGVLIISGTGSMYGYGLYNNTAPWGREITSVNIQNGVTSIGDCAFSTCSSLISVTIPETVESIGKNAFWECSGLKKAVIPVSVSRIEPFAFGGCSNLEEIDLPDSMSSIGQAAFSRCSSLKEFVIPNGITSIGLAVFSGSSNLTRITIPNGVTYIGESAFANCSDLSEIIIPESVIRIDTSAFSNCSDLTEIIIPDSVTSIEKSAFSGCSNLSQIITYCTGLAIDLEDLYLYGLPNAERTTVQTLHSAIIPMEEKAATCTESGSSGGFICAGCETITEESTVIDPIGHDWDEPTYVWAENNLSVTATRVCKRNSEHIETETATCSAATTLEPTCTNKGKTTYTPAVYTNAAFNAEEKTVEDIEPDPERHSWGEPTYIWAEDNSTVTGKRVCEHNAEHIDTETVETVETVTSAAKCEETGLSDYQSAVFMNNAFTQQSKTNVETPQLGHDYPDEWNNTATCTNAGIESRTCRRVGCGKTETRNTEALGHRFGEWTITENPTCNEAGTENRSCQREGCTVTETRTVDATGHHITATAAREPTCISTGNIAFWFCDRCNKYFSDENLEHEIDLANTVIAASDEKHIPGEPKFENEIAATCTIEGSYEENTYCDICKTIISSVRKTQNPLGHAWGAVTYEWSEDQCTAFRTCDNNPRDHIETETVTAVVSRTEPTYDETGEIEYTATFTNVAFTKQTRIEELAQLVRPPEEVGPVVPVGEQEVEGGVYIIRANGTAVYKKPTKAKSQIEIPDSIKVTVDGQVIDVAVTEISAEAFKSARKKVTQVIIGRNVQVIGDNAFAKCTKLKTVKGGNSVVRIGKGAFSGCKALTKFTFYEKVNKIGSKAFYQCEKLKTLVFKGNCDLTIGSKAFSKIYEKVKVTLPKSVKKDYTKKMKKPGKLPSEAKIKGK